MEKALVSENQLNSLNRTGSSQVSRFEEIYLKVVTHLQMETGSVHLLLQQGSCRDVFGVQKAPLCSTVHGIALFALRNLTARSRQNISHTKTMETLHLMFQISELLIKIISGKPCSRNNWQDFCR